MENINTNHPEITVLAQKSTNILRVGSVETELQNSISLVEKPARAWSLKFLSSYFQFTTKTLQETVYLHRSKATKHHFIQTIEFRKKKTNKPSLFQACSSSLSSSKKHLPGQASKEPLRSNSPKALGTSHSERWVASSSGRVGALLLASLWDNTWLKKAAALMCRFPNWEAARFLWKWLGFNKRACNGPKKKTQ